MDAPERDHEEELQPASGNRADWLGEGAARASMRSLRMRLDS